MPYFLLNRSFSLMRHFGLIPIVPSYKTNNRYMLASNRFQMPVDWGTGGSAFVADSSATGRSGASGTALARHYYRRIKFSTGNWAPKRGIFLWQNSALGVVGVLDGLFSFTLTKVEIRTTADVLVETIKWGGVGSKSMAPGAFVWSDPCADLQALTTYYLDVYWSSTNALDAFPTAFQNYLDGELSGGSLATDYSIAGRPTALTARGFAIGGNSYGPSAFLAQGWDGLSPCILGQGDSINDQTSTAAFLATARGDTGFVHKAMGSATGGTMTYGFIGRYSSASISMLTDNLSGFGGKNLIDWLYAAFSVVQASAPFTAIFDEHGRNDAGAGLAQQQSWLTQKVTKWRSYYPNMPYFVCTTPPNSRANNNTYWTTEADQVAGDTDAHGTNIEIAGAILNQMNNWKIALAGGLITGCFDTGAVCRGSQYHLWKERSFSTTVSTAIVAATSYIVHLADSPNIGATLVFEPGDATNVDSQSYGYCVGAVAPHAGGGFDVTLYRDARNSEAVPASAAQYGRVVKAHASGTVVKSRSSNDGLHPSNETQEEMAAPIIAGKAAITDASRAWASAA